LDVTDLANCRNAELHPARSAMREVEDRFNKRFGYPWVFVNDEPFTDEFIKLTTALATGRTEYGIGTISDYSNDSIDTERILVVSTLGGPAKG